MSTNEEEEQQQQIATAEAAAAAANDNIFGSLCREWVHSFFYIMIVFCELVLESFTEASFSLYACVSVYLSVCIHKFSLVHRIVQMNTQII